MRVCGCNATLLLLAREANACRGSDTVGQPAWRHSCRCGAALRQCG
eukprot:COSAG05_NODE_20676_length_277_cov_1.449438_1_plen_45_part_10